MGISMALPLNPANDSDTHPLNYASIDLNALVEQSRQQEVSARENLLSRERGGASLDRRDSEVRSSHSHRGSGEQDYLSEHGEVDDTWLLRSKRPWWKSSWRWVQIGTLLGLVAGIGVAVSWLGPIVLDKVSRFDHKRSR
jgi:hypothetical protein